MSLRQAALHIDGVRNSQAATIGWTNGCFDLLHAGHIALLRAARRATDLLVVGINSDESVARLKGPQRPVCRLEDRVAVLDELRCVDVVVVLSHDVPTPEIAALRPDLCFKDDSYATLPMPERATIERYGGEVRLLQRIEGMSTTNTIETIAKRHGGKST